MIRFSKPKTPGFGISQSYYITILASRANLPTISQVVNPKGEGGAVIGFGVPLSKNSTAEDIHRPLQRGAYAISSKDRKTVFRCLVLSKEEAGFEPETFARSSLAEQVSPELVHRILATWSLIQLCFESHDPSVGPSLKLLLELSIRLAELTDGVIADPVSKRYLLASDFPMVALAETITAAAHIAVHSKSEPNGFTVFTLGMQKFGLPELEIEEVQQPVLETAEAFLLSVCQTALTGKLVTVGALLGSRNTPFQVIESKTDRSHMHGSACFELVPTDSNSVEASLEDWYSENR